MRKQKLVYICMFKVHPKNTFSIGVFCILCVESINVFFQLLILCILTISSTRETSVGEKNKASNERLEKQDDYIV
jgi:hypothetical protein